jgi:Protein of unknown function (DUF2510)
MSQPPQDPYGQQRQESYPGPQYGAPGAQPPPGWYPDPGGQPVLRWWDGTAWAPHTQPVPGTQSGAGPEAVGQDAVGRRSPKGSGPHWVRNIFAVIGALVVAGAIISFLSNGNSSGGSTPDAAADPAPTATVACTTNACIATDAQQALPGTVAKDDSVMTKATCKPSTVTRNAGGTYTVTCTVNYSDGMVARGDANLIPAQDEITFEPTDIINYGSGG